MALDTTYRIGGLTQLLAAEKTVGAKTQGVLTDHLLKIGDMVKLEVRELYGPYSIKGGQGVQEKVFTSGLWVVQTIVKSRDPAMRRPNFGPLMFRKAFAPAVQHKEEAIVLAADLAVAEVTGVYWNG